MNQPNYDRLFEEIKAISHGKKLLLHVCCAPCATHCLTRLLDTFDITLFFSNDNITNKAEWQKRLNEVTKLVDIVNSGQFVVPAAFPLKLVVPTFDSDKFFRAAQGLEAQPEGGKRCEKCFELRLSATRDFAQEKGFDYFGTTLSVSPYKNSKLLNSIGLALQQQVKFLPADFKKQGGYDQSIALSERYGLYRQHYCGCVFSDWQIKLQQ